MFLSMSCICPCLSHVYVYEMFMSMACLCLDNANNLYSFEFMKNDTLLIEPNKSKTFVPFLKHCIRYHIIEFSQAD